MSTLLHPTFFSCSSGSFAVVKRAVSRKTGEEFAIKIIKKIKLNADELATVHDEVEIMHKIHHPHCIQLVEMFESKKKIWMVMDLLTGGELFDRIVSKGSYSEREASDVVRSVASALEYLHSIGITHRDLKVRKNSDSTSSPFYSPPPCPTAFTTTSVTQPCSHCHDVLCHFLCVSQPENLLYKSPEANSKIVLTDFGLAKYKSLKEIATQGMKTACGTPGYVSPEIVMNVHYTSKTDMWSLGVIAYILLCGFPPFYSESTHQLYQQIKAGDYSFPSPYWTEISSSAKDLIRHLLCVDPVKRYSATDVLRHPWVGGENVSTKALCSGYSKRLIALQCRRRLRRGVKVLLAINRFTSALQSDEQIKAATAAVSGDGQVVQPMEG